MKCWFCEVEARAVCHFCGRAVCKEYYSEMSSFIAMYQGKSRTPKGVAVARVIWCGECEPQPDPIPMPELF